MLSLLVIATESVLNPMQEEISQCSDEITPMNSEQQATILSEQRLSQDNSFCPGLSCRPASPVRSKIWLHCPALPDRTGSPAEPTLFLSYIRFLVIYHTHMSPSLSFEQVRFYSFHMRISLPTVFKNLFIKIRHTQVNTNFALDFGFDLEFFRTRFKIECFYFRSYCSVANVCSKESFPHYRIRIMSNPSIRFSTRLTLSHH